MKRFFTNLWDGILIVLEELWFPFGSALAAANDWVTRRFPRSIRFSFNMITLTGLLFAVTLKWLPEFSSITGALFMFALFLGVIFFSDWRTSPHQDPLDQIIEKGNVAYALLFVAFSLIAVAAILRV